MIVMKNIFELFIKYLGSAIIIAVLLFYSGCEKDSSNPTQPVIKNESWKLDNNFFREDKILLNSYVSNGTFTIASFEAVSRFDSSSLAPDINVIANPSFSLAFKPAFGDELWVYGIPTSKYFQLVSPYFPQAGIGYLRLHDWDNTYSLNAFALAGYYNLPIGAFNNQGTFLSVIADTDGTSFCLIDFNVTDFTYGNPTLKISPKITKIILQGFDKNISYAPLISPIKDKFFIGTNIGNFIAYPDGSYKRLSQINGVAEDMFTYNDTLYVLTSNSELYSSVDDGENWVDFASNFPSNQARHFYIGDSVYFYVYSQLFHADFNSGKVQELDNSGLEGNAITSVNLFGDKVWVTTLSGLFYKSADNFLTYKTQSPSPKILNRIMSWKIQIHK